jgi:hypothetical protein
MTLKNYFFFSQDPVPDALQEMSRIFWPHLPLLTTDDFTVLRSLADGLIPLEMLTLKICEDNCNLLQVNS